MNDPAPSRLPGMLAISGIFSLAVAAALLSSAEPDWDSKPGRPQVASSSAPAPVTAIQPEGKAVQEAPRIPEPSGAPEDSPRESDRSRAGEDGGDDNLSKASRDLAGRQAGAGAGSPSGYSEDAGDASDAGEGRDGSAPASGRASDSGSVPASAHASDRSLGTAVEALAGTLAGTAPAYGGGGAGPSPAASVAGAGARAEAEAGTVTVRQACYRPAWSFRPLSPEAEAIRAEADALSDLNDHLEAAEAWGRLASALRRDLGESAPAAAAAESRRANQLQQIVADKEKYQAALGLARDALAKATGEASEETLFAQATAASVAGGKAAADWLSEAERLARSRLGPEHPLTLSITASRGWAVFSLGGPANSAEGQRIMEDAWGIQRRIQGPDSPDALRTANFYANARLEEGAAREAADIFQEVLRAREKYPGPEGYHVAETCLNLSLALSDMQDYTGARDASLRGMAAAERSLGPDHVLSIALVESLGFIAVSRGDFRGAAEHFRRAAESFEASTGPEAPRTLGAKTNYAYALAQTGEPERAAEILRDVVPAMEKTNGPAHPDTLTAVGALADAMSAAGDLEGGMALGLDVVERLREALGPEHHKTLAATHNLAIDSCH